MLSVVSKSANTHGNPNNRKIIPMNKTHWELSENEWCLQYNKHWITMIF